MGCTSMVVLLCGCLVLAPATSVTAGETFSADGLIEPHKVVNVGSPTTGTLKTVKADRGDNVAENQVLATLHAGVEKASMDLAKEQAAREAAVRLNHVRLDYARRKLLRIDELYKKEALSFEIMDETQTNRALADVELQKAVEDKRIAELDHLRAVEVFNRMTIRSPISGVVVERFLSPGEYVENQPILKIAQIDPLNVEVILPIERLGTIKVGAKAKILPQAPVGGEYIATVKIVDKVVDSASLTFGVRLEMPNPDHRISAGIKCRVVFFPE